MNIKSIRAGLALLFCLAALAAAAAGPAGAKESQYACKCKGVQDWILFVPHYVECGGGYAGGSVGDIHSNLSEKSITGFIPPGTADRVINDNQCGYYPESGWNCGKMKNNIPPACIYK